MQGSDFGMIYMPWTRKKNPLIPAAGSIECDVPTYENDVWKHSNANNNNKNITEAHFLTIRLRQDSAMYGH